MSIKILMFDLTRISVAVEVLGEVLFKFLSRNHYLIMALGQGGKLGGLKVFTNVSGNRFIDCNRYSDQIK